MKRETVCLVTGQLVCLAAVGWLWSENRSVREQLQEVGELSRKRPAAFAEPVSTEKTSQASAPSPTKAPESRKNRPAPRPLVVKPDRTAPVSAPGQNSAVERIRDRGASRATEGETGGPVNSIHPVVDTVTADDPDSLLQNGGFEEGLEPWTCEKGKIAEDPDEARNSVLEIALDEEGFLLSQPFQWPVGKQELTLAYRVKAAEETDLASTAIEVRLLSEDGKALTLSTSFHELKADWAVLTVPVTRGNFVPVAIEIKGTGGKGTMWIDDVILK
jgi:hypothetical protein